MISQGFVQDALASLTARGIDPGPVLARAGIAPDARGPVDNLQYGRLWLAIADRIGCEIFGMAARPMRPAAALACRPLATITPDDLPMISGDPPCRNVPISPRS